MNTIRHEYGHYLQWKDYGGLGYIGRGIKSKFWNGPSDENPFELNADERACEQFSRIGFNPVYYEGADECAHWGY